LAFVSPVRPDPDTEYSRRDFARRDFQTFRHAINQLVKVAIKRPIELIEPAVRGRKMIAYAVGLVLTHWETVEVSTPFEFVFAIEVH
jgi:hypothetical protein